MSFRTAEPALKDVLDGIASGQIQLPDFQRGWVWDDNHIRSLIASLSLSYPIGAVMFLEAGGVPFKPRLFSANRAPQLTVKIYQFRMLQQIAYRGACSHLAYPLAHRAH